MTLTLDLIHHMRRVVGADRDLRDLGLLWQMIEASSAISCPEDSETILPTLSETRSRFENLQQRLIHQLAEEGLAELADDLGSKGRCTIDILVRNLFERTADVGFLATDKDLRIFCAAPAGDRTALLPALQKRLVEYRAKYTVYEEVIVLAPDGVVLARIEPSASIAMTTDTIVAEAVAHRSFIERFRVTDLAPGAQPALLYAHRIEDHAGSCVGVLVLRFRFHDEMQRIFASVSTTGDCKAVVLMDHDNVVLVSNDEGHIPIGTRLVATNDSEVALLNFAGREYLSVTNISRGYQGYLGPGWKARVMISVETAFRHKHAADPSDDQSVSLDNDELRAVQSEVDAINRNLRRVVWNGRLMASANDSETARLKAVLQQVTLAGGRTRGRVAQAIDDLYRTSLGRARQQASDLARLAADIMDRNLYERANDCRWWALSPELRQTLSRPVDAEGTAALSRVLSTINGLYTVYTRLVVFDLEGRVVGLSRDAESGSLLGTVLPPSMLLSVQQLTDSQRYAVSAFEASPLSDDAPSYIYLAAVRAPANQQVVGGIAIVFNAEREFRSILDDVLAGQQGVAAFIDAERRVVASTESGQEIGALLPFDPANPIIEHDGAHHAVAMHCASGYREFKCSDGYANGIRAVVAVRLGPLDRRNQVQSDLTIRSLHSGSRESTLDAALFQVGAHRFALPAPSVLEARSINGMVKTPSGTPHAVGLLEVVRGQVSQVITVFCARSLVGVNYPARATDGVVLVVARTDGAGADFGLRVDDVLTVTEVSAEHRQPVPAGLNAALPLLQSLLRVNSDGGELLIQLLDMPSLRRRLGLVQARILGEPEVA